MYMQANKKRWWRIPLLIWLVLVAGLPIYYLRPDCDWYYARWGTPECIEKSRIDLCSLISNKEEVYTRIFVVRPAVDNMAMLGEASVETKPQQDMLPLLRKYELPAPYRYWYWRVHGSVYYVVCGDGRLLLRDSSRNKGGLFSSRMAFVELSDLLEQHPLHVVFFYLWGFVGTVVLILSGLLAVPCALLAVPCALLAGLRRLHHHQS
jgi:hypothetical protein